MNLENVQAKEKIMTELPVRHAPRQVLMRGRQNTDLQGLCLGGADGQDFVKLQDAQELRLHRQRNVGHLVEKHGAAVGQGQQPRSRLCRASEGALCVAEQLALHKVRIERGNVNRQERVARDRH